MKSLVVLILINMVGVKITYSQQGWLPKTFSGGNLVSIDFINDTDGFMFRSNRWLFKTSNKGQTWDSSYISSAIADIEAGMFYNNNTGCFIPHVSVTTNSGASWNQGSLPHIGMIFIQSITMISQNTGFVSAIDADILDLPVEPIIYRTTNAGINWEEVFRGSGANNYADIMFINNSTGFQCRFSIFKTTDSGTTWALHSQTGRQRTKFSRAFGDTMYMSSADGYIAKSINLGANWTEYHSGVNETLTNIHFINNIYGFAVGDMGSIVKTTNGGINWIVQNSGTNKRLNDVFFLNKDTGFVVGDSGLLLYTYTGGVTSITQNHQTMPEQFKLYQNYPNPFNPSTTIKFDIIKGGDVNLKIFTISGELVEILIDRNLEPGNYEYEFQSNLPSGIYFYRLEANNYLSTKRMVLVK